MEGKIIFARINVDRNEIDDIHIENFPHVKLYKAGLDHPITLHERKNENGLIYWLGVNSNFGYIFAHDEL
jgi:protein disulfide-isomerase A1